MAKRPFPETRTLDDPQPSTTRLRVRSGSGEWILGIDRARFRIGRADDNDHRVGDAYASRHHAGIALRSGTFYLTDKSRNGTLVVFGDGRTVHARDETVPLEGRGTIRVGHAGGSEIAFCVEVLDQDGSWREADLPHATGPASGEENVLRCEGDYWTIVFGGELCRLKDTKGVRYLARLLQHPGREFHAVELAAEAEGPTDTSSGSTATPAVRPEDLERLGMRVSGLGDAGELLDPQARAAYKHRLRTLDEALEEARAQGDGERAAQVQEEIDFLARELTAGIGLGGRERRAGSPGERARVNVTRAVRAVMEKIEKSNRALGDHLGRTLKTGQFCSYDPDPRAPISWRIS